MWTSPTELKCLWMWLLFGFVKGNKGEKCPAPPRTEFVDITVEAYAAGTELYYECDSGYDRKSGDYPGIKCNREEQGASWAYSGFKCIDKKILLSMGPTTELNFTQEPESKTQSPAPQKPENFSKFDQKDGTILLSTAPTVELEFTQKPETKTRSPAAQKQGDLSESAPKDFCGPPKTIPHASLKLKKHYYVGQELHFKCQSGYDKRLPTSGTSTCKKVNGSIIWTPLDMRCTNDSNKWPPQTTEPGSTRPFIGSTHPFIGLTHPFIGSTHPFVGSTHPSPSSSVTLPVTALCLVLLIIPAVLV